MHKEVMDKFNKLEAELTSIQEQIRKYNHEFENFESEDIRLRNEIKYEAKNMSQIEQKITKLK